MWFTSLILRETDRPGRALASLKPSSKSQTQANLPLWKGRRLIVYRKMMSREMKVIAIDKRLRRALPMNPRPTFLRQSAASLRCCAVAACLPSTPSLQPSLWKCPSPLQVDTSSLRPRGQDDPPLFLCLDGRHRTVTLLRGLKDFDCFMCPHGENRAVR